MPPFQSNAIFPRSPHVLVRADRVIPHLAPLTDICPPALLPVAGTPLLFHTLDTLARAGIHHVIVAISQHAGMIAEALGDGQRWGLAVTCLPTDGRASDDMLRTRVDSAEQHDLLTVDPMMLWPTANSPALIGMGLDWLRGQVHPATYAVVTTDSACLAGLTLRRARATLAGVRSSSVLRWNGAVMAIRTLSEYHAANMAAAGDEPHIGRFTTIDGSARLSGRVVIGDGCVIGPDTVIHDSVVLPHTRVAAGLRIKHAIIAESHILQSFGRIAAPPPGHVHTPAPTPWRQLGQLAGSLPRLRGAQQSRALPNIAAPPLECPP